MLAQAVLLIYPANIVSAIFTLGNSFLKEINCFFRNLTTLKASLKQNPRMTHADNQKKA
jgi:hypothetical protein